MAGIPFKNNIDLNNAVKVINSPDPTNAQDVSTKNYADTLFATFSQVPKNANFTIDDTYHNKLIVLRGALTVTFPAANTLRSDFTCKFVQYGANQTTFAGLGTGFAPYDLNKTLGTTAQVVAMRITDDLANTKIVLSGDLA